MNSFYVTLGQISAMSVVTFVGVPMYKYYCNYKGMPYKIASFNKHDKSMNTENESNTCIKSDNHENTIKELLDRIINQ
jgi:hypothetical protein